MRRLIIAAATAAACAGSIGIANAADPSEGSVSNASPTVEWTGLLAEGAASYNAFNNNPDAPCAPPGCDTFTLTVADAGPLTLVCELQRTGSTGDADCGFRITDPSGTTTFTGGPSGPGKPFTMKIKNAPKGEYAIGVTDSFIGSPGNYKAKATLGAGTTPAPPPPAATPAPQTTPPAQSAPGTTMSITTRSASSRKLRKAKKLVVGLRSSAPVDNITVTLKKGAKKLASGKVAAIVTSGRATLKLKGKARRLKTGKYRLIASGTDKQGRPVSTGATRRVKR